jgi:hypothetical protein
MKLKSLALAAFAAALLVMGTSNAQAELVITFSQSGADVVANGSGSLNWVDLSFNGFNFGGPFVDASSGQAMIGQVPAVYSDIYVGNVTGPASFGSGGLFNASSGSSTAPGSTAAGIDAANSAIFVPGGYGAGNFFTVSSTWANTTIAGLGLTPGVYTWTWGTNNVDDLKIIVPGSNPVPEPSSLALAGLGAIGAAIAAYRRRRVAA